MNHNDTKSVLWLCLWEGCKTTSVDFNQGKTGTAVSDLCSLFDDSSVSSGEIEAKGLKLLIHFYGNYLDKYTRGRSRTPITSKM